MEILSEISPNENLALALGFFDGVHLGHKKIINTLIEHAKLKNLKTAVITFKKNPSNFFKPVSSLNIQTLEQRACALEMLGVDYLYELDFEKYKYLEAIEYLEDILIKNFKPKIITVGYNHAFGKKRKGTPEFLKAHANKYNYNCIIVPEEKFNNKKVSSTIIRNFLQKGSLKVANELLTRPFSILGIVQKGDNLASKLGFPTANINWNNDIIKLPYGVYFGLAKVDSKTYHALINWGVKPTVKNENKEVLEAHIYNFNENIYNKTIEISFIEKTRDEKKFKNITELKNRINKDYASFKLWLG